MPDTPHLSHPMVRQGPSSTLVPQRTFDKGSSPLHASIPRRLAGRLLFRIACWLNYEKQNEASRQSSGDLEALNNGDSTPSLSTVTSLALSSEPPRPSRNDTFTPPAARAGGSDRLRDSLQRASKKNRPAHYIALQETEGGSSLRCRRALSRLGRLLALVIEKSLF